jgi:hypothetical protein
MLLWRDSLLWREFHMYWAGWSVLDVLYEMDELEVG